jgi:hypothetical protein
MEAPTSCQDSTPKSGEASDSTWRPSVVVGALHLEVLKTIGGIADRLRNAQVVQRKVGSWPAPSDSERWAPTSLACGFPSQVVLFAHLAAALVDDTWETVAREYLRLIGEATQREPVTEEGLFSRGTAGIALAVRSMDSMHEGYRRAYDKLNAQLATQVIDAQPRRSARFSDYDTIAGPAGVLGQLVSSGSNDEVVDEAIRRLLSNLVVWVHSLDENGNRSWFIAPGHLPTPTHRRLFPRGYFDIGMAHGLAGPLAALSLAWTSGYRVDGQMEAIDEASDWLVARHIDDEFGINWPHGIPLEASTSDARWRRLPPGRDSWCYGSPGIARSLWLAGGALGSSSLQQTALAAFQAVAARPSVRWNLKSSNLCHGRAGLLMITLRFAHDADTDDGRRIIPALVQQILDDCDEALPFLVCDRSGTTPAHDPGLLSGAAGVALALLAAVTGIEPAWDRALLIA